MNLMHQNNVLVLDAPQSLPLANGMSGVQGVFDNLQGNFEPVGEVRGFVDGAKTTLT